MPRKRFYAVLNVVHKLLAHTHTNTAFMNLSAAMPPPPRPPQRPPPPRERNLNHGPPFLDRRRSYRWLIARFRIFSPRFALSLRLLPKPLLSHFFFFFFFASFPSFLPPARLEVVQEGRMEEGGDTTIPHFFPPFESLKEAVIVLHNFATTNFLLPSCEASSFVKKKLARTLRSPNVVRTTKKR